MPSLNVKATPIGNSMHRSQAPAARLPDVSVTRFEQPENSLCRATVRLYRVGPGERFGFGTSIGAREPIHLRLKRWNPITHVRLPKDYPAAKRAPFSFLEPIESQPELPGHPAFGRLNQSSDGIVFDIDLTLPSDLKVWRSEQYGTGVLTSLTGSNRLVYFRPVFEEGTSDEVNPLDVFRSPEWYQDKSRFWLIQ